MENLNLKGKNQPQHSPSEIESYLTEYYNEPFVRTKVISETKDYVLIILYRNVPGILEFRLLVNKNTLVAYIWSVTETKDDFIILTRKVDNMNSYWDLFGGKVISIDRELALSKNIRGIVKALQMELI